MYATKQNGGKVDKLFSLHNFFVEFSLLLLLIMTPFVTKNFFTA